MVVPRKVLTSKAEDMTTSMHPQIHHKRKLGEPRTRRCLRCRACCALGMQRTRLSRRQEEAALPRQSGIQRVKTLIAIFQNF